MLTGTVFPTKNLAKMSEKSKQLQRNNQRKNSHRRYFLAYNAGKRVNLLKGDFVGEKLC